MEEELVKALQGHAVQLGEGATGQAATTRAPVQIPDILEEREYTGTRVRPMLNRFGYRSASRGSSSSRAANHGRT